MAYISCVCPVDSSCCRVVFFGDVAIRQDSDQERVHNYVLLMALLSLYIIGVLFALNDIKDNQCNAAHISVSLDEEERVHCGWAVLIQIRQLSISGLYLLTIVRMLIYYRTIKDSGPLLESYCFSRFSFV